MLQVTKIITYLCSMELLVTCQSVGAFQVDLSLVDGATVATSFELEVKVSMQMYWSWNPGVWSIISGRVKKLIAQGENETRCKASRLESSLHDSASDLAFVCVSWQYQIDPRDSFFQEKDGSQESTRSRVGMLLPPTVQVIWVHYISVMQYVNDGMPWDPGGVIGSRIQAIAWGQAIFCRSGSVTPYIPSRPCLSYVLCSWARPGRSTLELVR
jgi:hypothetical protein